MQNEYGYAYPKDHAIGYVRYNGVFDGHYPAWFDEGLGGSNWSEDRDRWIIWDNGHVREVIRTGEVLVRIPKESAEDEHPFEYKVMSCTELCMDYAIYPSTESTPSPQ
jgi:hypothetical protein